MQKSIHTLLSYAKRSALAMFNAKIVASAIIHNYKKEDIKNLLRDVINFSYFVKRYGVQLKNEKGYWNYDPENNIITTPQGIKFYLNYFDPYIFAETFLYDIHFCDFNLKDKVVVQAGAFIGDTPLYYAYRGAKVYAFEPDYISLI